ncbi:MAG: glycosyltransferase family 39 protein [Candidatus Moraniibacteriota bacterium]|nr:MAG: glycosyltransferase family 39 protein [Candidatus Moranbacteria bacterium]
MKKLKNPLFWVYIALIAYFSFSLPNLTHYTTADEHFWLPNIGEERVLEYWRAIGSGDWEKTRINDKPGITLAYISGIAIPFTQHLYDKQRFSDPDNVVFQYDPQITKIMHFSYRFPLVLFTGFFMLYIFHILKKITKNKKIAAISVIFFLSSPVLVGISHIVNPDSLFWIFGTATLLTYIYTLQNKSSSRYIWLTGLFFGLSLASKYVSIIFIPFLLLLMGLWYIFHFENEFNDNAKRKNFSKHLTKNIRNFIAIIVGSFFLFALMMPAALVDPVIFYESTIGFPGMPPVFVLIALFCFIILLDAYFLKSKIAFSIFSFLSKHSVFLERIIYGILIISSLFVFFNWISKNSIIDLSGIPFYAKTKASFTTDNPYWVRYVMEFVPLVFALTPLTFFLLLLYWIQGFFQQVKYRFFGFSLSLFFFIFFIAVVEQGLLVTVRYNIILFPLACILASMALIENTSSLKIKERIPRKYFLIALLTLILTAYILNAFVGYHSSQEASLKFQFEYIIGMYRSIIFPLIIILFSGSLYFLFRFIDRSSFFQKIKFFFFSFPVIAFGIVIIASISLFSAYPHFFLYTNSYLPTRYILNHPWGYGGYEAAQYLNELPDAKNITLWANAHGVCEFFVGKCIRKQKLDIEKYPIDYLFFAHMGSLQAKFETESETVWAYYPDNRKINFVKLEKNDYQASLEKAMLKKYIENFTPKLDQE